MGYLPPGDDVRRLHHLESRFAPVARRLIAMYPGAPVPLAASQEAVARWFGHPTWHAVVTRQSRVAARGPSPRPAPDPITTGGEQAWLTGVPVKILKILADSLKKQLNLYRDHDRGPSQAYWTDGKAFDLMARVMGFDTSLSLNQAWAARQPGLKPRPSWWSLTVALLRPTPPDGPWTWARSQDDLPGSLTHPLDEKASYQKLEPMARALGQDLDSGWWMGMTDSQVRTHTLLVGELGSGRDSVLAGWVTEAMRQGQGAVWLCGHEADRAREIEQRFNDQARLCWRDQDRWTLNLSGEPDRPGSRSVRVNLLDMFSAGGLTEILVSLMDGLPPDTMMWKGRSISLLAAVCMALVWERDQQGRPLSLTRLRNAFELDVLHRMARQDDGPTHIRASLRAYLTSLPYHQESAPDEPVVFHPVTQEQHTFLKDLITAGLDALAPFEERLFNTTDPVRPRWSDLCTSPSLLLIQCGERSGSALPRVLQVALKAWLATNLGVSLEDGYAEVTEKHDALPPRAVWVFDNVPASMARGMAVLPAQARAFGIGVINAMDSLERMKDLSITSDEFYASLGNCNTKVLMRQQGMEVLNAAWTALVPPMETSPIPPEHGATRAMLPPTAEVRPEVLRHYAIGEALVVYKDAWWHVGLSHNLRSPL